MERTYIKSIINGKSVTLLILKDWGDAMSAMDENEILYSRKKTPTGLWSKWKKSEVIDVHI